jgi:hypothetical protein
LLNIGLFTPEALVADPSTRYAIKEEHILHANDDKEKTEHVHPSGVMNGRMINFGSIYFCEIHLHKKNSEIFFGAVPRTCLPAGRRTKVATRLNNFLFWNNIRKPVAFTSGLMLCHQNF